MRLIVAGGALMFFSGWFRYAYGAWGAEISFFSRIYWNLRWDSWYMWLWTWPAAFGFIQAVCAALSFVTSQRVAERCRWISSACLVGAMALIDLVATVVNSASIQWGEMAVRAWLAERVVVLCAIALFIALRRPHWVTFIGLIWILRGMYPISDSVPVGDIFLIYGMGYWMLLAGTILVGVGSLRQNRSVSDALPSNNGGAA